MGTNRRGLVLFAVLFLAVLPIKAQDIKYVLDSAVITAKRTALSIKDNVIQYDISRDSLAAAMSLRSLISSLPLVTYNQTNQELKINGNDNIVILLNGRRSLIINKSNFQYISEFIHGKDLESISIDISPTGLYSGYYEVINITSKDALSNFYSVSLAASASSDFRADPSVSMTFAIGKLATNFKYIYGWSDMRPSWQNTRKTDTDGSSSDTYVATDTTKSSRSGSHGVSIDLSYDLTGSDVFFVSASGNFTESRSHINSYSQINEVLNSSSSINKNNRNSITTSLAYQHYFDKTNQKMLTLQYSLDNRTGEDIYEPSSNSNKTGNVQHIVSADYLHTISTFTNWNANVTWFARRYGSSTSGFDYLFIHQDVVQTSLNASRRSGKFLLFAKASYDLTSDRADFNNSASHLNDNYGTLHYLGRLQWFFRPGNILMFTINGDVYRPDIYVRNPYRDESVSGVVTQGNPLLSNSKSTGIVLSFMRMRGNKFSANFMASYRFSSNGVFAVTRVLEDGRLLKTYDNGIKENKLFVSAGFMWNPVSKIRLNASYRLGFNRFSRPGLAHSYTDHFVLFDASFKAWRGGEVNLNAMVANPSLQSLAASQSTKIHYLVNGFVGIVQNLGKGWFAGISVSEPWYVRRNIILDYEADTQCYHQIQSSPGHVFRMTIRYDFGRFRGSVKRNSRQVTDTDRSK